MKGHGCVKNPKAMCDLWHCQDDRGKAEVQQDRKVSLNNDICPFEK